MDKPIRVQITDEDIGLGCKRNAANCPITRAVLRATGAAMALATTQYIQWTMANGKRFRMKTPKAAFNFMCRFDHDYWVKPFTMDLFPESLEQACL